MVKYITQSLTHSKVREHHLIDSIVNSEDWMTILQTDLDKDRPGLMDVYDSNKIAVLQQFIKDHLEKKISDLEKAVREGECMEKLEQQVLRMIKVQRKLNGNNTYLRQGGFETLYLRALVWSSRMVLSEEILRLLSEFSFDKSLKLFYYYFKYYMCHLNLYNPQELKIKLLFTHSSEFSFHFQANTPVSIDIPHLPTFMAHHCIPNFYHLALFLNQHYKLGLSHEDYLFHALMVKAKMILDNDTNACVRTVLNAFWVFSYIDVAWLRSDDKFQGIPDIFPLPPNYTAFFKDFLEIFFEKLATPPTHLCILEIMESVIGLQERIAHHQDIFLSLSQNSSLIIKILEYVNNYLTFANQYSDLVPIQTLKEKNVLSKLMGIVCSQIAQATDLHSLAQEISIRIFSKKTQVECNQKVLSVSGQILVLVEMEDSQLLKVCFQNIKNDPNIAIPYVQTLNLLLDTKNTRQRRDVGALARIIAESQIFQILQANVEKQAETKNLKSKGLIEQIFILCGKICSENPSLIQILNSYQCLKTIFSFFHCIEQVQNTETVLNAINFLHNISLKEYEVRDYVISNVIENFLRQIFQTKVFTSITHRQFNHFLTTLHRFAGNISKSVYSIFKGLVYCLKDTSRQYKQLVNIETFLVEGRKIDEEVLDTLEKIDKIDSKLIILLKLFDKSKETLVSKMPGKWLYDLYKKLVKLCFTRSNVLLDCPNQSKSLISLIHQLRVYCNKKLFEATNLKEKQKNSDIVVEGSISLTDGIDFMAEDANEREQPENNKNQIALQEDKQVQMEEQPKDNEEAVMEIEQVDKKKEDKNDEEDKDVQKISAQIKKQGNSQRKYEVLSKHFHKYIEIMKENIQMVEAKDIPKKIYEIFLQNKQLTKQHIHLLKIGISMSKIERTICYINKEVGEEQFYRFKYEDMLLEAQKTLSFLQLVVSHSNIRIIVKNMYNLKQIMGETVVLHKRQESNKIISEESLGKELHLRLQQKWTFYHNAVEGFVKSLPSNVAYLGQNFGKKVVEEIIIPFIISTDKKLAALEEKQSLELIDYQFIRYGMKIFLQLFCALYASPDHKVMKPINHVLIYFYYFTSPQIPSLLGIMARKLNLLIKSGVTMEGQLRDSQKNRDIVIRRIIFKMIKNRIKSFITNVYHSEITHPKCLQNQKQQPIVAYLYIKIREDLTHFITSIKPTRYTCLINLDDIRQLVYEKIFKMNVFQREYKLPQLPEIPLKNLAQDQKQVSLQVYDKEIMKKDQKFIDWILSDFTNLLGELEMKHIFDQIETLEKNPQADQKVVSSIKRILKKHLDVVCSRIKKAASSLFENYDLKFPYGQTEGTKSQRRKKKRGIQAGNRLEQVNIREEVRVVVNGNLYMKWFVKFLQQQKYFNQGDIIIYPSFICELMRLNCEIIGNYEFAEGQDKYTMQADLITKNSLHLIQVYAGYYEQYHKFVENRRKERRREKKQLKKMMNRKMDENQGQYMNGDEELQNQCEQQMEQQDLHQEEQKEESEVDQQDEKKKRKKRRKRRNRKNKTKNDQKQGEKERERGGQILQTPPFEVRQASSSRMKRVQSMPDLNFSSLNKNKHENNRLETPRVRKDTLSQEPAINKNTKQSKKMQISMKGVRKLCGMIETLLVNIFVCSEDHPFLKCETLQTIMKFMKKYTHLDPLSKQFEGKYEPIHLNVSQFIPHILKTRICEIKHAGFFHLLSQFAYHLIQPNQICVDIEIGVKRLFFEKRISNKQGLSLKQFEDFMGRYLNIESSALGYFLHIRYSGKKKQNKEEKGQQVFEFTKQNINKLKKQKKSKHCKVYLKEGCELNMIDFKSKQKRKGSNMLNDNNEADSGKMVDYVPPKNLSNFVHQVIVSITKILVRNMNEVNAHNQMQNETEEQIPKVDVFNITILVEVLQVLMRQSPSMGPFITKYKCRKIILQCLQVCSTNTRKMMGELLELENKKQITFLSFIIRVLSPLFFNRIFTLVFEMCLDSTVIQKQRPTSQQASVSYVTFGHVVRQRTINQIMSQLTRTSSLIKKMTLLNLFTMLLSIKEFASIFIENHSMLTKLENIYIEIMTLLKGSTFNKKSFFGKKVLIPFFVSPISLIRQLNISMHIQKSKMKKYCQIRLINNMDSVNEQLIPSQFFYSTKFKQNWINTGIQANLDEPEIQEQSDGDDSEAGSSDRSHSFEEDDILNEDILNEIPMSISMSQGNQQYGEHTNSWINNIQVSDQLGSMSDDMGSGSEPVQSNHTININLYPEDSDHIIEQDEGEELSDSYDQEEGNEDLQMEIEEALMDRHHNSPMPGDLQLEIQSILSGFNNRPFLARRGVNIYEQFDQIITHDRNDHHNQIYKIQRDQESTLRLILNLYAKPKDPMLDHDQQLLKMILQFPNPVPIHQKQGEENQKMLLCYVERIQFTNFQMFEAFFWNMPDYGIKSNIRDRQFEFNADRRDLFGFDEPQNARGRRNQRNRRHGVLNMNLNLTNVEEMNPNQIAQRIRRTVLGERPQERQEQQQVPENQQRVNAEQSVVEPQGQQINIQNSNGENVVVDMDEEMIPQNYQVFPIHHDRNNFQRDQRNFGGMSYNQVESALQTQGFSMENFLNLPMEIQDDILNNIRQQSFQNEGRQMPFIIPQLHEEFSPFQILQEQNNHSVIQSNSMNSQNDEENLQSSESEGSPSSRSQRRDQNQRNRNINTDIPENLRKFTIEHNKKLRKDIISLLNKDGKYDSKFPAASDAFLISLMELFYLLNQNDHLHFPYSLVICLCVNSQNQQKILSTLIGILALGPDYGNTDNQSNKDSTFPSRIIKTNEGQIYQNYAQKGYPIIATKILHLFSHMTKLYSLAISFMNKHNQALGNIPSYLLQDRTLLQVLINLLRYEQILKNTDNIDFLLATINNITSMKFNLHISQMLSIVHGKKQENKMVAESPQKNDGQKDDKNAEEGHKASIRLSQRQMSGNIDLTEENNSLLCKLLANDDLKQNSHMVSKIIMRLSIDEKNLHSFIAFFKEIIKNLAAKLATKMQQNYQKYGDQGNITGHKLSSKQKMQRSAEQPKIVQLLMIFNDIMKSLKTSVTSQEKETNIITEFKQILLCEPIKNLCQIGCDIIQKNPSSPQLIPTLHQFIDCFFAIFNMLTERDQSTKDKQKYEIKIATLGQISDSIALQKRKMPKFKFISDYINLQYLWEKKICTPQGRVFINANIRSKLISVLKGNMWYRQTLFQIPIISIALETPHMLEFDNKKSLFKAEIKRMKFRKNYPTVQLLLNRNQVFQQSFTEIYNRSAEQLKGKLQIQFEGEEGQDAGGLTRQWYQLLSKEMFNPNYALFTPSSTGNTYQPFARSYFNGDHLRYFKFIGRVMGKALHDGFMLDAYFTPAFYKHILSLPITFDDMEQEDYQMYNSLKWILNNSPIQDYLELYFVYEYDNFGVVETRELIENGDKILVEEKNKLEYVQLISYAKMATSVQKQLQSFLQGFHQFIPPRLVRIFDEKELQIMISGLPTIDINELRANTDLVNYHKTDQIIVWLFQVLENFQMSLRTAFLQFVTGTSRVPPDGFKGLQGFNGPQKFNIHKDFDTQHLPRAHTCFNQLDLPPYSSKQILIEKLTMAITEASQGFGII